MMRNKWMLTAALVVVVLAGVLGYGWMTGWFGGAAQDPASLADAPAAGGNASKAINGVVQDGSGREVLYWYDPMVPQHRFNEPGKSPFMDMQLVPKYADEVGEGGIAISSQTQQNLGIRTAPVTREAYAETVRAVGEIGPDERGIHVVQTRVAGFVERLLVRAEGDRVKRGQKLAEVYVPDLLSAQEELLALNQLSGLENLKPMQKAARQRLRLLGMTEAEIDAVIREGKPKVRIGIYSPTEGIVQQLGVREGAAVMPGDSLFQILDLDQVWLSLEVPERELGQVLQAEDVNVTTSAYPGESFEGRVDYLYPTIDSATRTARLRVVLDNPEERLLPGMYAEAELESPARESLWVPSQAVIYTGERQVVIVQEEMGFRPATVVVGQQTGNRTEILEGLKAGESVVVSGQFLIDSEASLNGVLARLAPSGPQMQEPGVETAWHEGIGTIQALDLKAGTVTLAHDPIPSMDWPAMTMPFRVRHPADLQGLEPGARVRFEVLGEPEDGGYIVDELEAVKVLDKTGGQP